MIAVNLNKCKASKEQQIERLRGDKCITLKRDYRTIKMKIMLRKELVIDVFSK